MIYLKEIALEFINLIEKYGYQNFSYEVIEECSKKNFVNDERFAEFKINSYLRAGKPKRYIEQKLKQKGRGNKDVF